METVSNQLPLSMPNGHSSSSQPSNKLIALLIDSDNISKNYLEILIEELNNFGDITYKRIYGDFTQTALQPWKQTLLDFAIEPMQQYSYVSGKNATDSAMIIDAMDILYKGSVNCVCLATSDSDFTKLATRFRNENFFVIGAGETKTPKSFRAACHRFLLMDVLLRESMESKEQDEEDIVSGIDNKNNPKIKKPFAKDQKAKPNQQEEQKRQEEHKRQNDEHKRKIIRLAEQIIWDEGDLNGYMHFSTFMQALYKKENAFNPKNYGKHANSKAFFKQLKKEDGQLAFIIDRKDNYDIIKMNDGK